MLSVNGNRLYRARQNTFAAVYFFVLPLCYFFFYAAPSMFFMIYVASRPRCYARCYYVGFAAMLHAATYEDMLSAGVCCARSAYYALLLRYDAMMLPLIAAFSDIFDASRRHTMIYFHASAIIHTQLTFRCHDSPSLRSRHGHVTPSFR